MKNDSLMVSRDLAERIQRLLFGSMFEFVETGEKALKMAEELRALLDAPVAHQHEWDINSEGTATVCSICGIRSSDEPAASVVERQPVDLYQKFHEIAIEAAVFATVRYGYMPKTVNDDWKPHTWVIAAMHKAVEFYTTPPELAELQATIDHLRNDLEGTRLLDADQLLKINQLTAEIERLKDGQGEPVALYPRCTILKECNTSASGYSLQSAPVSVVPTEIHKQLVEMRQQFERANFVSLGKLLNACLDKVKELDQ